MNHEPDNLFAREHRELDRLLREHLLQLVGGDFPTAQLAFDRWWTALVEHVRVEETQLFPRIPQSARWSSRLYELEHQRIQSLAHEYAQLLLAVVIHPPQGEPARRAAVLALLDRAHPLRHVLEHHNQREETALADELPEDLQARAWERSARGRERRKRSAAQQPAPSRDS
ncbi:MAG TPA: hypothetical protein VF284_01635 [Rhodanobacteraceae bacterium]